MSALSWDSSQESSSVPKWSMVDAENAIKASFFSRMAEGVVPEKLRFSDIRSIIRDSRPISDRTLSKALRQLVDKGELRKAPNGSYERAVKWERKDRIEVAVAADKLSIDAGASVGSISDQRAGWTIYGIPFGKPRGLRPRLRLAAIRFQEEVDSILGEAAEGVTDSALAKARKRGLSAGDSRNFKRILLEAFDYWESLRVEHLDSYAWLFVMEKVAPGVFPKFIEKLLKPPLGVEHDLRAGLPAHESMANRPKEWIPYLARMFMEEEETVRNDWPKLLADAEAGAAAFEKLRKSLDVRDWTTFSAHWSSIIAARYWLCAVIR